MTYELAVETLLQRYKEIYKSKANSPEWATPKIDGSGRVHPSIPFVGKDYFNQPIKILLYASAENLNKYAGYLDDDALAVNRHRAHFEFHKEQNYSFPNVHIQPINNGALGLCVGYIMSKIADLEESTPAEFYETISFGNYGKYTIKAEKTNEDYAGSPSKLAESQEYIRADIEVLQPDYIIMVESMYSGAGAQKEFVDGIKGQAKVIPILQINATTVNTAKVIKEATAADLDMLHPALKRWYPNLRTISKDNFLRVFGYLDDVLSKVNAVES